MFTAIKKFFQQIRESEDRIRMRWMFLLSGVSMALVLGLWVGYLNLIVTPVSSLQAAAPTPEPSLRQIFAAGLSTIFGQMSESGAGMAEAAKKLLGGNKTITVTPEERNFVLETLPPVPQTPLP